MYVITGATGNTGKPLAMALLEAGKDVRVISRRPEKAKGLTDKGAELFVGDTSDVDLLTRAFTGATAVYAMIPPAWAAEDFAAHQHRHAQAIAAALEKTGVKYVISLSSVGTHLEKEAGVVSGLRDAEKMYDAIPGLNTLHLRPTYFMENTIGMIGMIKAMGIMGSPVKADLPMNMIATRDIAAYAAKRMLAQDFSGHNTQYLLGQRDLTYGEVARILGQAIGKPDLSYVEFSYEDFKQAMKQIGASDSMADNMNTFIKSLNEGKVLEDAVRTEDSTTPTSLEEFSRLFAQIYQNS